MTYQLYSVMQADMQKMKDAICSAVDVMQAMSSSICLLLSKVFLTLSMVPFSVRFVSLFQFLSSCNYHFLWNLRILVKYQSNYWTSMPKILIMSSISSCCKTVLDLSREYLELRRRICFSFSLLINKNSALLLLGQFIPPEATGNISSWSFYCEPTSLHAKLLKLLQVGIVNSSIAELTSVVAKERALLDQCRDHLSTAAALQVKCHI